MSPADFGTECILAARLVALLAWEADRVASKTKRVAKGQVIGEEIAAQREWFATDQSLDVRGLLDLSLTRTAYFETARETLVRLGGQLSDGQRNAVLVEVATSIRFPRSGISWEVRPEEAIAEQLMLLDERMAVGPVQTVARAHKQTVGRLRRQSLGRGTSVAFQLGTVGLSIAGATVGAPAVGEVVGTLVLGLHGAAATSAGLALLGGGSLTAGGFGMAGGVLVVELTGRAAKVGLIGGARFLGTHIAAKSRALFLHELAKLDVLVRLTGDSALQTRLRHSLRSMLSEIEEAARPASEERKDAQRSWPRAPVSPESGAAASTKAKEASNLEGSIRALRAEIEHLAARVHGLDPDRWVPWHTNFDLTDTLRA